MRNQLAKDCKLLNEEFEWNAERLSLGLSTEIESPPLWVAGLSTQRVCWTLCQHQMKTAGEALGTDKCSCPWQTRGREEPEVVSEFYTVQSQVRYQKCPTGGVGTQSTDVLKEAGCSNAALLALC